MQPDLVGMGRQVVLFLVVVGTPCHYLLAAGLEAFDGAGHLAQPSQARAREIVEHQQHPVDLGFLRGCLQHGEDIAQLGLVWRAGALEAQQLLANLVAEVAASLLDQRPAEMHDQGRLLLKPGMSADEQRDQYADHQRQE